MSGKLCDGTHAGSVRVRDAKSYCEGRKAAKGGALFGDTPFAPGTVGETVWAQGLSSWAADPNGAGAPPGGVDCCGKGLPFGGGFAGQMGVAAFDKRWGKPRMIDWILANMTGANVTRAELEKFSKQNLIDLVDVP